MSNRSTAVIIDTCVLSEVRHPKGDPAVKERLASYPDDRLYLSVLTIGETLKGIARMPPGPPREQLETWATGVRKMAAGRILDITLPVAARWGEIAGEAMTRGRQMPPIDGLIAATALHHGMKVMTRNTPDFQAAGVEVIDPWEAA